MEWLNPPPHWRNEGGDGGRILVTTGDRTDFWRITHYGFIRDNGHFLHEQRAGDFAAQVRVRGDYQSLYDQAGVMVRLDSEHWIKAGIEFTHGRAYMSVVVTRGASDWSLVPLPGSADANGWIGVRLTRRSGAIEVAWQLDGGEWTMARLAPLVDAPSLSVGMMCCSPERAGFQAEFEGWRIGPAGTSQA